MKQGLIKALSTVGILAVSAGLFMGVNALAKQEPEEKTEDTTPTVAVESIHADDHQVSLTAYGTLEPIEMTNLSSQVTGEVTYINAKFIEGGLVKKGETLFSVDKSSFEAALKQAEANLMSAQANLIEQQALADVAAEEARRHPDKTYTDLFLKKPQLLSAKATVKSAEAALSIAQRDLERCEVTAPYNALVVSKDIGLGQFVATGSPVTRLYNIESAKVVVPVPGFDVDYLPEQLKSAPVVLTSKKGGSREAVIWHDLGVIDEATRMTQLLIHLDDPYALEQPANVIKFGSYVQVDMKGKMLNQVVKVPQDLVKQQRVWVVGEESSLIPKDIKVIREEPGYYFVSEGLAEGDRLVTTLPEYPQEGMAVHVDGEPRKVAKKEDSEELASEEADI